MSDNLPNLPNSVKLFVSEMAPYSDGVALKDGKVIIQLKQAIWQTHEFYSEYVRFVKEQKAKFQIDTYTEQVYDTIGNHGKLKDISLEINVKKMVLDRLRFFFKPETEISISDAILFLLSQGLSDAELQRDLDIAKSTFHRYKNKNGGCAKMDNSQTVVSIPIQN